MENNADSVSVAALSRSAEDLLADRVFQKLLHQFSRTCITWDEFLEQPLPTGTSPKQIWSLLNNLSRAMGVNLAVPDLEDNWYRYRRTHEITDAVAIVSKACSSGSHLYQAVSEVSKRQFLFRIRVKDTIAATRLDGLSIADEDADVLLSFDRAPQNATERLIANTFNAVDQLPSLAGTSFSKDLFLHLRDLLLEGVDIGDIETLATPPLGLTLFDFPDETCARLADRQMEYISAWANHEAGDPFDHPAIRAMIINDCFRFYRPLGQVSNQVGRLVAHLYATRHDLPMFGLLPSSRAKLDWYEGRIAPPDVAFGREVFVQLRRLSPYDLTSMATVAAQLMVLALCEVERDVQLWEQRNSELRTILEADPGLNSRQRSILGQALRDADAEFSIRYHKTNNGISYPTARRDFIELVDKGYLSVQLRGRGFVFSASPGLHELVSDSREAMQEE
ncbi:MAG: hypothetical protein LBI64_08695 [Coriobacteriales bacterium]|jgi:hypothetical protein|nr:hypothetical protein [Coriobacteriales bacterium]